MEQGEYIFFLNQILYTMEHMQKELEKTGTCTNKRKAIVMNDVIGEIKLKISSIYGEMKEVKPMLNKTFKEEADKILMYWKERKEYVANLGLNVEVYKELMSVAEKFALTRIGDRVEEAKELVVTTINILNENIIVSLEYVQVSDSIVVQMAFKKYTNFKYSHTFYIREIEDLFYRGALEKILVEDIEQFKKNLLEHITGE